MIIYEGPSLLDGKDIAVILTGLPGSRPSENKKTGPVIQTWIISKDGFTAMHGKSVCGDCPIAGANCYVKLHQEVSAVWKRYKAGIYPKVSPRQASYKTFRYVVRLSAYGDAAAVPGRVWDDLLTRCESVIGYTHQWRNPVAEHLKRWCMASCESDVDVSLALSLGWRVYTIGKPGVPAFKCPYPTLQCSQCRLCSGTSGKGPNTIWTDKIQNAVSRRQLTKGNQK